MEFSNLRVAIFHYWLVSWRGGEKVMRSMLDLFPQADIYTLFYEETRCGKHLQGHRVVASSLNRPWLRKHYQKIFPLYPWGLQSLKLDRPYDLILSSESGPGKGFERGPFNQKTPHLCYVHTPMRYCYGFTEEYLKTLPSWQRPLAKQAFARLRRWDETTVSNVDLFLANSHNVQERVQRYWGRDSKVLHPGIADHLFAAPVSRQAKTHFLSFGALTPYKRIDLLVETFNQNRLPLVIIGEGSEMPKLQAKALPNIRFLGFVEDQELEAWIRGARALLFPGEEDFGMIPLEVMARGIPVIAYQKGGALETVLENPHNPAQSSGVFFQDQSVASLQKALVHFEQIEPEFDPQWIQNYAKSFEESRFQQELKVIIQNFLASPKS